MLKIIKNTLDLIFDQSGSSCGFLMKAESGSYEILSSASPDKKDYVDLNESILRFLKKEKPSFAELKKSKLLLELSKRDNLQSVFINEFNFGKVNNSSYYLFLFSNEEKWFNKIKINSIKPILDLLKNELAELEWKNIKNEEKIKLIDLDFYINNFETVFIVSNEFHFLLDKEGYFIKINFCGAEMLDYEPSEVAGIHFIDLISAKIKAATVKSFAEIISTKNITSFNTTFISKLGNEVLLDITVKPLIKDKEIEGILGTGKNITGIRTYKEKIKSLETKLLEAERIILTERTRSKRQKAFLDELNKMKRDFISNISHELRTPLASIIGFTETINSEPNMESEMKNEFVEIILNEGKRLAKLINELLDISRFDEGTIEIAKSEFNINDLLIEVINSNVKKIKEKNITLSHELHDENVILNADRDKIFQVLDGIIKNAVKYTSNDGRIYISSQSLFKEFEIIVSDTGSGISEKDLDSIFKKFQRVKFLDQEIEDTGLSLVFIKQIVDLHKGFITVQSNENKGTSVIIKLPRELKSSIS